MRKGQAKRFYVFGLFRIDVTERVLLSEKGSVPLTPKAFDLLLFLVENSGHVLDKEELMKQVWPDSFVEENNLAQNISTLRKVLGTEGARFIETVPKRGYRFVAAVNETWDEAEAFVGHEHTRSRIIIEETIDDEGLMPSVERKELAVIDVSPSPVKELSTALQFALERPPETMYARSGEVNIAYQVIGDAPLDLVFVMGWVSHLEYFWREPSFARFLLRLASFSRLILFDKRGTGLSDRVPINQLPTLEQRMDDVRAVMDAVGSERAALCGVSEGGPMCSLFA